MDYDLRRRDLREMKVGGRRNVEESATLAIEAIEELLKNQKEPKREKKAPAKKSAKK